MVIKNLHVGSVGISGTRKKEKNGQPSDGLSKLDRWTWCGGLAANEATRKMKNRRNGIKFAAKTMARKRATDNMHRDRKTGWCRTTQAVKSSAPANGNWHWCTTTHSRWLASKRGVTPHTQRACGTGGRMRGRCSRDLEKKKKRYFGGRSKNMAHDRQS